MEQFSKMIAAAMKLQEHRVENTLKLLQGGATIPFISRYRKEATGGMDEVQISEINDEAVRTCKAQGNHHFHYRGTGQDDSRTEEQD